jgi:uncharacterized protein (TIGR03118 family)
MSIHRPLHRLANVACAAFLLSAPTFLLADTFTQTNLVSNVPGLATTTDSNLINPWGVSFSATSPFWISNQGTGTSTLYSGTGVPAALMVTIPGSAHPPTGPTGQVFNNSGGGFVLSNGAAATFIFANLNGTLEGWNGGAASTAIVAATTPSAVYTGLAIGSNGSASFLYAADSTGGVRVFDSTWHDVTFSTFAGKFVDPTLPAGYVPFNVQLVGSSLYVTYAALTPFGGALPGGYVDVYDTSGNFVRRFSSDPSLFAPWGVTLAPSHFGSFSNDLLVGNFGNGSIGAFDPLSGLFLGSLGLTNSGLWALETRTGGTGVDTSAVYFTAGINGEQGGLFGKINVVPEPATIIETASGILAFALAKFRRR